MKLNIVILQLSILLLLILPVYQSITTTIKSSSKKITTNNNVGNNGPVDDYDPQLAEDLLLLSYNAYCPAVQIANWTCTNCEKYPQVKVNTVIYANSTDTQAYVATYNNTACYVGFRGSMDIDSWITNLKFLQVEYPGVAGALVHQGFFQAYQSVQQQVHDALVAAVTACPSCQTIYVIGHSLGGALATLCMADVAQWFPTIHTEAYTFGSPRVGNGVWASYYNSIQPNTFRVVWVDDLVPHVPPKDVVPVYDHVPTETWYPLNDTTAYKECNDSGEDPSCSDSVDPLKYSIYDHLHYFDQHCCCP